MTILEFRPDGVSWYTGEGQLGAMDMVRGTKAIRDHHQARKTVYFFVYKAPGPVVYVGGAVYLNHHRQDRPDRS